MNPISPAALAALALAAAIQIQPAMAQSTCWIRPDNNPGMTYDLNLGAVYVPRDAVAGSVIGVFEQPFGLTSNEGRYVECQNDGVSVLTFITRSQAPIFPGTLPPVLGQDFNGKVYETGVPGIGAVIRLGHPFDGLAADAFEPQGEPLVPFMALLRANVAALPISPLLGQVTLVKTGPIAPGPHMVDTPLFHGEFSLVPRAIDFNIRAHVIQAQCNAAAVSDDPVKLGEWRATQFSAPGTTTTPTPFSIRLSNCESDPNDDNLAWATVRLDGVNGSTPVPGVDGAFSLTSDSTAQGVAVQILRGDGVTPIALQQEVPIATLTPGDTVLDLSARYYQTAQANGVKAGQAKGSLSFTISYQ